MRVKIVTILLAGFLVLVGCQGAGDEQGRNDDQNRNIEQTRNVGDLDRNRNTDNRDGDIVNNRDRDRNRSNMQNINNRDNEYNVSEEAADKIVEEVDEIDRAYVLTTDNNAYVAAMLDADGNRTNNTNRKDHDDQTNNFRNDAVYDDDDLTDDVKRKISDIVQSVDNDIDNVYVTTNPDFMDLTNNYVDDMNNGKPIRGFFDQIGNMIERVFPQDRR